MKHSVATELLFDQVIADTPPEIKREVEWSYQIADKIYAALRRKGCRKRSLHVLLELPKPQCPSGLAVGIISPLRHWLRLRWR